jgi:GcrA cell cycle regulator
MLNKINYTLNIVYVMSWTEEKVNKLKELWGKGQTASQIAEIIGGVSRNAVIGKAHRLNLSSKIKTRSVSNNSKNYQKNNDEKQINLKGKRGRFKSLLLDKNFEPAKNLNLEELTEETCKYMEGHPNDKDSSFCGRKTVEKFSYCPLHLMIVFTPKNKKDDASEKDEEMPKFIQKKIKSA